MKTLHSIFHKGLIKNYLIIFVVSVISSIVALYTSSSAKESGILSIVNTISWILTFILPFATIVINSYFAKNVKWLINQHFNRLELIKFFFLSQTFKLLLFSLNYTLIFLIMEKFIKSEATLLSLFETSNLSYRYFTYFISLLIIIYIFYSSFLFSNNKEELQRMKFTKGKYKKEHTLLFLGALLGVTYILENCSFPIFVLGYGLSLFLCFSSLVIFNRTFKIYSSKKKYSYFAAISLMLCSPLIAILFFMRSDAQDMSISYKERASTVTALGFLNSSFSEGEMLSFLRESKKENYAELLDLFGSKVSFKKSISLIEDEYRAKQFIDFHSKSYTEEKTRVMVDYMSLLYVTKGYKFKFAEYSHSFFIEQKVSESYILELLDSDNSYKQLAAVYFTKRTLGLDKAIELYSSRVNLLNKDVKSSAYVKRWMTN